MRYSLIRLGEKLWKSQNERLSILRCWTWNCVFFSRSSVCHEKSIKTWVKGGRVVWNSWDSENMRYFSEFIWVISDDANYLLLLSSCGLLIMDNDVSCKDRTNAEIMQMIVIVCEQIGLRPTSCSSHVSSLLMKRIIAQTCCSNWIYSHVLGQLNLVYLWIYHSFEINSRFDLEWECFSHFFTSSLSSYRSFLLTLIICLTAGFSSKPFRKTKSVSLTPPSTSERLSFTCWKASVNEIKQKANIAHKCYDLPLVLYHTSSWEILCYASFDVVCATATQLPQRCSRMFTYFKDSLNLILLKTVNKVLFLLEN